MISATLFAAALAAAPAGAVPSFECPDADINRTYEFRWRAFGRHCEKTPEGWVITEFLPPVGWAGKYNTIVCAAGHHLREARWMHDTSVAADYARFWFSTNAPHRTKYSTWLGSSLLDVVRVTGDMALATNLLDGVVAAFDSWETQPVFFKTFDETSTFPMGGDGKGLFTSTDNREGSELSLSGDGYRPLFNSAMYGEKGNRGRAFHDGANDPAPDAWKKGGNFREQWERAIEADPDIVLVTGWNEWIAGRWQEWQGTPNAFPDQFSDEFSRDIEPADGILKDHFYYQLVANIRRYKGVSAEPVQAAGVKTYFHYANSTLPRDSEGWQGDHYTSDTMRNDFVKVAVRDDGRYIDMTVYTKDDITPYTDPAWMRIFIDTDPTGVSPNWEGFEYVINRENATEGEVNVERSLGDWAFEQTGTAAYTVKGNRMTLKIPAAALGLTDGRIHFRFKLSDNMQTDGDIMDFYKSGDVAPGGRFTFVY